MKILTRRGALRLLLLAAVLAVLLVNMVAMPEPDRQEPPPGLVAARPALASELRADVDYLAMTIGSRYVFRPEALARAADYLENEFRKAGYDTSRQVYEVAGVSCANVVAEWRGARAPDQIVVVGAHYDSVPGCPGANDNASGTASLLALARRMAGVPLAYTVRYVAFVNEEPPYFQTPRMGSFQYARACRERGDRIRSMLSIETVGSFSDEPGSQRYPPGFSLLYPDRGNFVGFVGNWSNRKLVRRVIETFRRHAAIPSEGSAPPGAIPGVGWSDHWSFWRAGYPALMVTDTAPFRYRHYHEPSDTPEKLDFARMALVVEGLLPVIRDLATE
jgi:Zn-dependent M28 family amino/carboxypeptidase